jgi:hypothetical protein
MLVGARYWSESFLERRSLSDNFPLGKDGHTAGLGRIKILILLSISVLNLMRINTKAFDVFCIHQ